MNFYIYICKAELRQIFDNVEVAAIRRNFDVNVGSAA
jgi:hypothetical protein